MEVGRFSQRSRFYLILFGVLILAVSALMIYPDHRRLKALDQNIEQLNVKIQKQQLLFPLFQTMLNEIDVQLPEGVVLPKTESLTPGQAQRIVAIFHQLADDCGLQVAEVSPDADSTLGGSGFMLVQILLRGHFVDLHEFLLTLGMLPYLEKVEQIKAQYTESGLQFRIKTWLRIEGSGMGRRAQAEERRVQRTPEGAGHGDMALNLLSSASMAC